MAAKTLARFDLTVIGGGIVGLAVARQVSMRHPKLKICVIEKEKELAMHQSRRNSGVVHRGIYYKKNSLKSRFCIKGAEMVKEYCQNKDIPFNQCGKLIVATMRDELETLHKLYANAKSNNITDIELIDKEKIKMIQPGCDNALEAIWSPKTAIVDWRQVALAYADDFKHWGGTIITNFTACKFEQGKKAAINIEDSRSGQIVETRSIVNCAGTFSDLFARMTGNEEHPKVVPFKGNYFMLSDRLSKTVKTNIYPVPDPRMPFLGVHITPRIDGTVLVGPTSLLTLGYEKYNEGESLNILQIYHILFRSGFIHMIRKKEYFKAGLVELYKFLSKRRLADEVQQLLAGVEEDDLIDMKFCGIRAQVLSKRGDLIDDFLFESGVYPKFSKVLHLRNCPSPAATSSLAIAERVTNILEERMI